MGKHSTRTGPSNIRYEYSLRAVVVQATISRVDFMAVSLEPSSEPDTK